MNPYRFIIWLPVLVLLSALVPTDILAIDESGCLTCHQYPGLVSPTDPSGFKVFHIDEQRYRKSPHGEIDCRKCHTTVEKVPHVGNTAVTCTNGCHVEQKDKKRIAEHDLETLHDDEQFYIVSLDDDTSCNVCHRLYPHKSNELARAFINMHIGFMTCETCHIKRDKFETLHYDWTSSETAEFAGEAFGARFNPKISDDADKSTHFISRISVFAMADGRQKPLVNTWDTDEARAYLEREAQLTPEQKQQRLDYFHRDIHGKEVSVTCGECHSKDSILDFRELGFSDKKANDLVYLNIKGLVTKYKVFYFPHLLDQ